MSQRQNRHPPSKQNLGSYPSNQPLIDPRDYGALEERVNNIISRVDTLETDVQNINKERTYRKGWISALIFAFTFFGGLLGWGLSNLIPILNMLKEFLKTN